MATFVEGMVATAGIAAPLTIIAAGIAIALLGNTLAQFSITLQYYLGWNVPWGIFSVLLTAGAVLMMIRGVAVSPKLAGLFFGFEMLVLVVVSIAALIKNGGTLSAACWPASPSSPTWPG